MNHNNTKKRKPPLRFTIIAQSEIISCNSSKVKMKHEQSFKKLTKLVLNFASLNSKDKLNLDDLTKYFGLPEVLAEYVFHQLIKENYLVQNSDESKKSAVLNRNKYSNFNEIPSEIVIRPINYNFSRFPRYYLPNWLINDEESYKTNSSSNLYSVFPLKNKDFIKNRNYFGVPANFISVEENSINSITILNEDVSIFIFPSEDQSKFDVKIRRSRLEKHPIKLDDNHPDLKIINEFCISYDFESSILNLISKISTNQIDIIDYDIVYDNQNRYWRFILKEVKENDISRVFRELETNFDGFDEIFNLKSGGRIGNIKKKINLKNDQIFPSIELKFRCLLDFSQSVSKLFFFEIFRRNFRRFSGELSEFKRFLEFFTSDFIQYFRISYKFLCPTLIEMREYYWKIEEYRISYCIMDLEDF